MRKGGYDEKVYLMYCDLRHVADHERIKVIVLKSLESSKKRYEQSPFRGMYGMPAGPPRRILNDGWRG